MKSDEPFKKSDLKLLHKLVHIKMSATNNDLLKSFGFRSMIDAKCQTWGSFTEVLFAEDDQRGEFDTVSFIFDLDFLPEKGFIQTNSVDDDSLDSVYFGRLIDHSILQFPKTETLKSKLKVISDNISLFFSIWGKNKLSEPKLIIHNIESDTISGYYIWQYK